MESKKIRVTENDTKKLREAIREAKTNDYRNSLYIQQLEGELDRAEIVPGKHIPEDDVTMNSRVLLTDLTDGEQMELTLVFPVDSGRDAGGVSVLAPIGTAMIGYRVGDEFEWDTPDGKTRLRVEKILYQPEAEGKLD